MKFRGVHERCGTAVETDLPADYPVDEGVGLWCEACDEAFWHEPRAPKTFLPPVAPEVVAVQNGARADTAPPPVEAEPEDTVSPSLRAAGVFAIVLILGLALLAVALLRDSDGGGEAEVTVTTPTPTVTATATVAPTPAPETVGGRGVVLDTPAGWEAAPSGVGRLAPDGSAGVAVSAAARRGRSLRRLGLDARTGLRRELRRYRVTGPASVDLNGRRALRVTARRGEAARELTVVSVGDQRFVVVLDLRDSAPRETRRAGRLVADSVVIR